MAGTSNAIKAVLIYSSFAVKRQNFSAHKKFGSGLVTLGIEKEKAKCGQWRLSWLVTESIMLRLPCVALIAEVKHAI
ncbi:MAG TPA: hypothetical protein VGC91_16930, partial [Pyrinomonadaceae bacterium]